MRFGKRAIAAACAIAVGLVSAPSGAVIIERVVAVVGERPILLSDLHHRGRPFLGRILTQGLPPAQTAAAETEMYKELLNKLIDERLEEQAADKARIQISSDELDAALRNVAANAHITLPELLAAARDSGLDEQDYRDEIRRQMVEGKLIQLRVRSRVRVTEQDGHAAYQRYIQELGSQLPVNIQVLALRLQPNMAPDEVKKVTNLANRIVDQARGGGDFCKLVAQYSQSPAPKPCGETGLQPQTSLVPPIARAVDGVAPGDVTEPIFIPDQAVLIAKVIERRAPTYEDVKSQMMERAYGDDMEHQRRIWLDELRRGVYLDVRL